MVAKVSDARRDRVPSESGFTSKYRVVFPRLFDDFYQEFTFD